MRTGATRTRTARRKKKSSPALWLRLWPLWLAIAATPFAVRSASVLALSGPSALRMLYPFVVLVQHHAQDFQGDQAETLSQWIMYGQFPFYAGVWLAVRRLVGATAGPLSALLLHGAGIAAALWTSGGN